MATHNVLTPPPTLPATDADAEQNALKQAFAIVNTLHPRLIGVGLTTDDLWDYVKVSQRAQSRADLTEKQRVVLVARLSAAEQDPRLFRSLCAEIRKHKITTLTPEENLFHVIQRQNKALVDVTLWHSEVLYSSCVANIEKMTVRGRQTDLRRIVQYITGKAVNHMTGEMLKNAILDHVLSTADVDIQTDPTLEAILEILQQHPGWMHLNDILEALNTERKEYILEILRNFYRQTLIEHNPYGSGLWFRWKHTQ